MTDALAEAERKLEDAAQALKRSNATTRRVLRDLRKAQEELAALGGKLHIHTTQPMEAQSDGDGER